MGFQEIVWNRWLMLSDRIHPIVKRGHQAYLRRTVPEIHFRMAALPLDQQDGLPRDRLEPLVDAFRSDSSHREARSPGIPPPHGTRDPLPHGCTAARSAGWASKRSSGTAG